MVLVWGAGWARDLEGKVRVRITYMQAVAVHCVCGWKVQDGKEDIVGGK